MGLGRAFGIERFDSFGGFRCEARIGLFSSSLSEEPPKIRSLLRLRAGVAPSGSFFSSGSGSVVTFGFWDLVAMEPAIDLRKLFLLREVPPIIWPYIIFI